MQTDRKPISSGFLSIRVIAAGTEVVGTLLRLEQVDQLANQRPQAGDGSLAGFAEHGLEAGEGLFDGVVVAP